MNWIIKKIIGSKHERDLKKLAPMVEKINALDESFKALSDADLKAKTANLQRSKREAHSMTLSLKPLL